MAPLAESAQLQGDVVPGGRAGAHAPEVCAGEAACFEAGARMDPRKTAKPPARNTQNRALP
jgi:hypothetical protein